MTQRFEHISKLSGNLNLPGDKSISHRSVMFASMADGISTIENLSNAEDVRSTLSCFVQLGCIAEQEGNKLKITGRGFRNFSAPDQPLFAGNSGTTARLMSGVLAAQNFSSVVTGDDSLSSRPMKRIIEPLEQMGAIIESVDGYKLPLKITPAVHLKAINYDMPVASAQVKSAVILAALHLKEETVINEFIATRNHTETMLDLKVENQLEGRKIFVSSKNYPKPRDYFVPSDISTAAFFIVFALLVENSRIFIKNVSLNATRTGILEILLAMGAKIEVENKKKSGGEEFGDLIIQSSKLQNIEIPVHLVPNIIDEIPVLSVAGLFANGNFRITGAKELRVKESDRIKSLCENYRLLGLDVEESEDGFILKGNLQPKNIQFESYHDHRIAMSMAVLSMLMNTGASVKNFECVNISNPDFMNQIRTLIQ